MDGTVGNQFGSPATVVGAGAAGSCRHAASVVGSTEELLRVAAAFLDAGNRAGDLTLLACRPETHEALGEAWGVRGSALVNDVGLILLGARPPDVFSHLRRHLERAAQQGSGRLRVLAEATALPEPEAWREEMRTEAVLNQVMHTAPLTAMCLYDARHVPAEVIDSAVRTHPLVVTGEGWARSNAFQEAADFVRALPRPRDPIEDGSPVFAVDDATTLPHLRHQLGDALAQLIPASDLRDDLHLALSEVAANAFRHGRPPVSARLWADDVRLVCTITDGGSSFDDPLAGFVPAHGYDLSRGGMGLWLARKLWDHVDLDSGPGGFTVRLSTARA